MRIINCLLILFFGFVIATNTFGQTEGELVITDNDTIPETPEIIQSQDDTVKLEVDTVTADTSLVSHSGELVATPQDAVLSVSGDILPEGQIEVTQNDTTFTEPIIAGPENQKTTKKDTIPTKSIALEPDTLSTKMPMDTIRYEPIKLTPFSASEYIKSLIFKEDLWRKKDDTVKLSLKRLVNHFQEPFDSVSKRLSQFHFDSLRFEATDIIDYDTIPIRWLMPNTFIVDTIPLSKDPLVSKKTIIVRVLDPESSPIADTIPAIKSHIESLIQTKDTIVDVFIDKDYLKTKGVQLYEIKNKKISPPIVPQARGKAARFTTDSTRIVVSTISQAIVGTKDSPFYIIPNKLLNDSLKHAVETLLSFTTERDSILLTITDIAGQETPLWLTTGRDDLYRYWVKNANNDSITVWIGNPAKSSISMVLEEEVNVERLEKRMVDDIPFTTLQPSKTLAESKPLKEIPIYWSKSLSNSFSLNQNHLSNWSRGGESSITSLLDINGKAEYNNKETKRKWTNTGRVRYGTTWTDDHGFRTNTDIVEINSQYNKALREKLDFSSILYIRTQVAKGYNYPADADPVVASKFLNPGALTIGTGLELKPNKKTSINISPLSYRNTFVLDTVMINQTAHGIERDKSARHEMGGQLVIKNSFTIFSDMEISNSARLFSNYLDKPQNVDVDWELSLEKQISWNFKIRFSFHLIYDDDILFPVTLPDGREKEVAKVQINQLLGLTLSFKI